MLQGVVAVGGQVVVEDGVLDGARGATLRAFHAAEHGLEELAPAQRFVLDLHQVVERRIVLVRDLAVEDGFPNPRLGDADGHALVDSECIHDLVAVDRGLEVAQAVLLLDLPHLFLHAVERAEVAPPPVRIPAGHVAAHECHEVVDVVAGLVQEAADGGVRHVLVHQRDGAVVQADHLLHVVESLVGRQAQRAEQIRDHSRSLVFVPVKGPAVLRTEVLRLRLGDVVEERGPPEPAGGFGVAVLRPLCEVVEHLQRVVKVVLVRPSVHLVDALEGLELWEDGLEHVGGFQDLEADRRLVGHDDFLQLVGDALLTQDVDAVRLVPHGMEDAIGHAERELCGKARGPNHAEWVVLERLVRIERRVDGTALQVAAAVEGVDQIAEAIGHERNRHRVDGKVAPVLVVLQCAVLNDGLAGVGPIALFAGGHELQDQRVGGLRIGRPLRRGNADRSGAEVGIDVRRPAAHRLSHGFRQFDAGARSHRHEVEVGRLAFQQHVADEAADGIRLDVFAGGNATDVSEDGTVRTGVQGLRNGVDVGVRAHLRHGEEDLSASFPRFLQTGGEHRSGARAG